MLNMAMNLCAAIVICFFCLNVESGHVFDDFLGNKTPCGKYCGETFKQDLQTPCRRGCRLLVLIEMSHEVLNRSDVELTCTASCNEAFKQQAVEAKACDDGCKKEIGVTPIPTENKQTLHVLTPLMYVKSAYNTMAQHVKQFVSTSLTLYVEEDSGKMVILQSKPKTVVEVSEYVTGTKRTGKDSSRNWQTERTDWMDCISQQSGLPRWILVSVLFGFIIALLWLCCVTTVTAPNHHIISKPKKVSAKNDFAYLYLYEPIEEVKIQPPSDMQAPPLPEKVNLA